MPRGKKTLFGLNMRSNLSIYFKTKLIEEYNRERNKLEDEAE